MAASSESAMAPALLAKSRRGRLRGIRHSKNDASQRLSWMVAVRAIYSASVDDNAWVSCFLDECKMGPPLKNHTYPEIEMRSSGQLAQLESLKLWRSVFALAPP